MYKSEFSKLCQDSKVSNVILDDIGNGFKMCFENLNKCKPAYWRISYIRC